MDIGDFDELHYIAPIANLRSMLSEGILCNQAASKVEHDSVAAEEIQDRRRKVRVPTPSGSRPLHAYANLYFSARNPMLRRVCDRHTELAVLRVSKDVLQLPGVVVTDCNASSDHVRFGDGVSGLAIVDKEMVFAEWWTDPDPIAYFRRKSAKCAEVLVPDRVPPSLILGCYVSTEENVIRTRKFRLTREFDVTENRHLFFQ